MQARQHTTDTASVNVFSRKFLASAQGAVFCVSSACRTCVHGRTHATRFSQPRPATYEKTGRGAGRSQCRRDCDAAALAGRVGLGVEHLSGDERARSYASEADESHHEPVRNVDLRPHVTETDNLSNSGGVHGYGNADPGESQSKCITRCIK